nr:cytochrome c oxidase subunit 2 [Pseudolycoriella hygida]
MIATWSNLNLQDSNSPLMEQLIFFHDHSMLILILITILVLYIMFTLMLNKYTHRFLISGQMIETIWTIIPAIILMFIALPSLRLLYLLDENFMPMITIKSIGHQWYWSYEYSDFKMIDFDSYMIPINEMNNNNFRLLDVDNRIILPFNINIRVLISSTDVIHSWTVPSLGTKVDGTPGRLNQTNFQLNRPGLYYGQCSEICGTNHSFMPIVIESVNLKYFMKWAKNFN